MTTPVTPAEIEALEALYAKTDQGAMWFAADFLDSWTPQASAYIAAALNAMPRLLAALRDKNAELVDLLGECLTLIRDRERVPVIFDDDLHLLTSRIDAAIAAGVAALKGGGGACKGGGDA